MGPPLLSTFSSRANLVLHVVKLCFHTHTLPRPAFGLTKYARVTAFAPTRHPTAAPVRNCTANILYAISLQALLTGQHHTARLTYASR